MYSFFSAGTKSSKKQVDISDEIISKPLAEQAENDVEQKVRRRHKNKVHKDSERTIMITESASQNISHDQVVSHDQTGSDISSHKPSDKSVPNSNQSSHSNDTNSKSGKLILKEKVENGAVNNAKQKVDQKLSDGQSIEVDQWSQNQQIVLEWALKQYPKGTDQRWEKIAEHVPGKTKVRPSKVCRHRFCTSTNY